MKASEIEVGRYYTANVSGVTATVRVDQIREREGYNNSYTTVYDVTNMRTRRTMTFRSARRFRSPARLTIG